MCCSLKAHYNNYNTHWPVSIAQTGSYAMTTDDQSFTWSDNNKIQ